MFQRKPKKGKKKFTSKKHSKLINLNRKKEEEGLGEEKEQRGKRGKTKHNANKLKNHKKPINF